MAITDPSTFVPDTSGTTGDDRWGGQGPAMAANGNIGGLMQALAGASGPQTPVAPRGILSRDQIDQVSSAMQSRIRTPDQMATEKADRRSAFDQLKAANSTPLDDWSPERHMALGNLEAQDAGLKPWDIGSVNAHGTMRAYQAELQKLQAQRQSQIDNAKGEVGFQQGEDKTASEDEKNVLADYAKMAAAQARVDAMTNKMNNPLGRVKNIGGAAVDVGAVDQFGNPAPRVLVPSNKMAELESHYVKMAEQAANLPTMNFQAANGKSAVQVRQEWVDNYAKQKIQEHLIGAMGTGPSTMVASPPANGPVPALGGYAQASAQAPAQGATPSAVPAPAVSASPAIQPSPQPGGVTNGSIRTFAGLNNVPMEKPIPQYLAELDKEIAKTTNPEGLRILQAERAKVAAQLAANPAPAAPAVVPAAAAPGAKPVAPAVAPDGGVRLDTNEQQAGDITRNKDQNAAIVKEVDSVYKPMGNGAASTIASMDNILRLGDQFTPAGFNGWRAAAAPYLKDLGILPETYNKWKTLSEAQVELASAMNKVIKSQPDAARFTDKDQQRVAAQMAQLSGTPEGYKFAAKTAKEDALRGLALYEHVSPLQNDPEYQKGTKTLSRAALDKSTSLGPVFMQLPSDDGKSQANTFRHEYIEKVMRMNKMDAGDKSERGQKVRAAAEASWNDMASKRGMR